MESLIMKKLYLLILIFVLNFNVLKVHSQVGIELTGMDQKFTNWNVVITNYALEEYSFLKYSYGAGVNYWFRLKNFRVEFTPGLNYMFSDFKFDNPDCSFHYLSHSIVAEFDVNIYPFDLRKKRYERDCPSFSNKGEFFSKGFFFQVSPGIFGSYRNVSDKYIKQKDLAGKLDFGAGIDIGINRFFMIAPVLKYGLTFANDWTGFSDFHAEKSYNDKTPGSYFSLSLNFYLK